MAVTKIHGIKTTVDKAIEYICNPDKTDQNLYISSFACSPETAALDFKYTLDHTHDCRDPHNTNKAFHLIQAFSPGEVSYEEAHQIGRELADRLLEGKYSYVLTTHTDKGHVHNHLIFCSADNITFSHYHDCKKNYWKIRNLSDTLCQEHNLSTIMPNGKKGMKYNEWAANKSESSKKTQLRKDINQTIRIVSTYSEFLTFMEAKGYEIKNAEFGENSRKYITFRSPDMSRPVRGSAKSLGKNFTKERIKERINNKLHRTTVPSVRNKLIDTNTPNIAGNIGLQKWANKENLKIVSAEYNKMFTHNLHNFSELEDRIALLPPNIAGNIGLQKWANKENLKIVSAEYNKMFTHNLHNFSELEDRIALLHMQQKEVNTSVVSLESQIRHLREMLKYAEQYQKNKIYDDHYKSSKDPDRYFRKYESQIILFAGAEHILQENGMDLKHLNSNKLQEQIADLISRKESLNTQYVSFKQEIKELELIHQNLSKYLKQDAPEIQRSSHNQLPSL